MQGGYKLNDFVSKSSFSSNWTLSTGQNIPSLWLPPSIKSVSMLSDELGNAMVQALQEETMVVSTSKNNDKTESTNAVPLEARLVTFEATMLLHATEGQLIWNRYNTMLAANSVFASLLGIALSRGLSTITGVLLVLCGSILGLYLSWQWRGLIKRGWELQYEWAKYAGTFKWNGLKNPFDFYDDWCEEQGRKGLDDWIAIYARRVIWLFMFIYCGVACIGIALLINLFLHYLPPMIGGL